MGVKLKYVIFFLEHSMAINNSQEKGRPLSIVFPIILPCFLKGASEEAALIISAVLKAFVNSLLRWVDVHSLITVLKFWVLLLLYLALSPPRGPEFCCCMILGKRCVVSTDIWLYTGVPAVSHRRLQLHMFGRRSVVQRCLFSCSESQVPPCASPAQDPQASTCQMFFWHLLICRRTFACQRVSFQPPPPSICTVSQAADVGSNAGKLRPVRLDR